MPRKFGIEIEMIPNLSSGSIKSALERAGFSLSSFRARSSSEMWRLTSDSSVTQGRYRSVGHELISPVLSGESGLDQIREVCKQISRSNSYLRGKYPILDKSCGFHVHVDTQDLTPGQFALMVVIYGKVEDVLYRLVSPSRRSKSCCKPNGLNVDKFWCDVQYARSKAGVISFANQHMTGRAAGEEKYRGLNLRSYASRGDVEFRMHEGCVDPEVVSSWIRLLVALVDQAKLPMSPVMAENDWTLNHVERFLGWDSRMNSVRISDTRRVIRRRYRDMRVELARAR